jgi:hypothetical protein
MYRVPPASALVAAIVSGTPPTVSKDDEAVAKLNEIERGNVPHPKLSSRAIAFQLDTVDSAEIMPLAINSTSQRYRRGFFPETL